MINSFKNKYNVVLIYTDQQRYDTIGALGNKIIKTPGMDRLVKEGTAFTQATTPSPDCKPARWSLLTGQWPKSHRCFSDQHLGPGQVFNLTLLLQQTGYITGLIGKSNSFLSKEDIIYFNENPKAGSKAATLLRTKWLEEKGREFPFLGKKPIKGGIQADPDFAKTEAAINFVKLAKDDPFFLWLSYDHPHPPYYISEPYFSMYKNADIRKPIVETKQQAKTKPFRQSFHRQNNDKILSLTEDDIVFMQHVYYGMISFVDREIGRFIDVLESMHLLDQTLIILMSDHGDYLGDYGMISKGPGLHDCLIKTPLIMRHPDTVPMDNINEELVSHVDIMPTVLDYAGKSIPDTVEGINLTPYIQGKKSGLREYVFSEFGCPEEPYDAERLSKEEIKPGDYHSPENKNLPWEDNPVSVAGRVRMIKNQDWKLVEEADGTKELYDLKNDPDELGNLYGSKKCTKIQSEMQNNLDKWKKDLADNQ